MSKITPCLWFDTEGEEAANFYLSVFPNSRILDVSYYGEAAPEKAGTVHDRDVRARRPALRGAQWRPAVHVRRGDLVPDRLRAPRKRSTSTGRKLVEGGEEGPCGWLKDRFGVSWQVVPTASSSCSRDPDPADRRAGHARDVAMKKIDIAAIEEAAYGAVR